MYVRSILHNRFVVLGWIVALSLGYFSPGAANAAGPGSSLEPQGVYPLGARPYGRSWGEWSAAWWQWALGLPTSSHPLLDTASCAAGQSGPVWFLGGAFTGTATTRSCTVPAGTALFFPLLNSECSTVEPPPFYGADEAELRACAAGWVDIGSDVFCVVDGAAIENAVDYRVVSPLFAFDAPDDNIFGIPGPISGSSVSDGYWVFLTPLSAGHHVIHFGGMFPGFPLDITYELTVLPGGRRRGSISSDVDTWSQVKQIYR